MTRRLSALRTRFEEMDRTAGEVVVSWIRVAMGLSMLAVLAAGGSMDYYPTAAWTVLALGVAYSWLALVKVAREASRGEVSRRTAWFLTALDNGVIVVLTGLTGAATSPMLPILVLIVITEGIRYSLRGALLTASGAAAALVPVILSVPRPDLAFDERVRQAGWWTWMLVSGGILAGVLSYAADLAHTRRARAEAEAEAEHRRLEEERRLRQRLEAIDKARKDFLHALSHDFRTPIASLEALAEALGWTRNPLSPAEREEVIELIQGHARELGVMLQEVREVAITESLGADQRVEITDVYMPEVIRTAAAAAGLSPEQLVSFIGQGLKVLHTDGRKILRILTNLLENAYRHSPPRERIEVRLARRENRVELVVLDRGPGMPEEIAAQAFEKFVSFGEWRSSGLGMWIVCQFVAALGGEVLVENRPGGGLAVRVHFPLERVCPAPVEATPEAVLAGDLSDPLDLSHRRRAQAESEAEAERQRLEMERVLRRRLVGLDDARRAFLSALLHEFRPSVSSLSALSRALRRDEHDLAPEERAEMLERMDGSAHHLDAVLREVAEVLVSESLDVRHRTELADVYLPQLVGTAATMSGLPIGRLAVRGEADASLVRTDSDKCLRVLVKALEEAVRHCPPDGDVDVHVSRRGEMAEVYVSVRRDQPDTAQPDEPAPSLGLWIASRLAESMGGGLACEAQAGGGLAVRAWFPALPSPAPDARPSRAQELTR
jgi:K+-sensing histidine kinase KdpD